MVATALQQNTMDTKQEIISFIQLVYNGEIVVNDTLVISPNTLDIYIPELQLAFEINVVRDHGETQGKPASYHLTKTRECAAKGVRLIHVLDKEWIMSQKIVESRISSLLGINNRIPARKTSVIQLTSRQATEFFNNNHIQGAVGASVTYGLVYEDQIVAAMSFGKPRYNKKVQWELIRSANKIGTNVVGGGSKLFKNFVKKHNPNNVISYSDKRWNTGDLYRRIGFEHIQSTRPNYYYFMPDNTNTMYHRSHFQKHKLPKLLDVFDPNMTEWQNMQANGYDRIWDCGNDVFVWTNPNPVDLQILEF